MTEDRTCPRCGEPVPPDAPAGECPRCLLEAGLNEAAPDPPFTHEELAELFPQLEVLDFVGQGGMGVVYKARQRSLDRIVALKILPREVAGDPDFAERFNREARALARLNHPHIVGVHESGRAGDLYYLLMEYVDGVNLRQAQRAGRLAPREALAVVPQVCDALQYAHDEGVVHRDIKPANILLGRDGKVKIADFGLAKLLRTQGEDRSLTGEGQVMGTVHYMAPEQFRTPREVDHRADIYSLGVVFYEMLTGDLPLGRFAAPSEKVEVDVRLDRVVLRTLEQERERRYQSAGDVRTDIRTINESAPAHGRSCGPVRQSVSVAPAGERRLSVLALVGVLLFPVALIVGVSASELGAFEESSIIIAAGIAVIGWILCGVAYFAIKRNPGRLYGHRLAGSGLVFVPIATALFVLVSVMLTSVGSNGVMSDLLASQVDNWLYELDQLEGSVTREHVDHLIDPERRAWFEGISDEKFAGLREKEELGFAMIDLQTLRGPITRYDLTEWGVDGFSGYAVIEYESERIRFPVVWYGSAWYLAIGKVERSGVER